MDAAETRLGTNEAAPLAAASERATMTTRLDADDTLLADGATERAALSDRIDPIASRSASNETAAVAAAASSCKALLADYPELAQQGVDHERRWRHLHSGLRRRGRAPELPVAAVAASA